MWLCGLCGWRVVHPNLANKVLQRLMATEAIQIDYRMAKIPPPTEQMMEASAVAAFQHMKAKVELNTQTKSADWDELHSWLQEAWIESCKIIYGVIAVHGGALVKNLDEENMKKKLEENE